MAVNDDITIVKGGFSVTLFTETSTENFKNILKVVPGVVAPNKQSEGVKESTVVDLLRITHTLIFNAYITASTTQTAKEIKEDLKSIFNSGDVNSSPATLTYEDESLDVFLEDLVIKNIKSDDTVVTSSYPGKDAAEYQVTLTVVEGKLVGT